MPIPTNWEDLHDATLKRITVNWSEGTCALELVLSADPFRSASILCTGLRNLTLQHEAPWGPSVSVNRARVLARAEAQSSELQIEMQSGDIISIEAGSVELCSDS